MTPFYPTICGYENLYLAFYRARQGKRKQENVSRFERDLEPQLFQLQEELLAKTYRPGAYRSFYRTESKRRLISAAPFRDRVVHHALVHVIQPEFERRFIFDSYANRVGKGAHRALDRCTQYLRASRYVLQCDIRQFFPSVDHAILRAELARVIPDGDVLWLADRVLETGVGVLDEMYDMQWFPGDDPSTGSGQGLFAANRPRGLPIGNLTSQFWANVHLNPFDQFVKRELKCRRYIRYVDDFLLFADNKSTLREWQGAIIDFLAGLRLTIHENAAHIRPVGEGLPFLGFLVFPDHRRLKSARGHDFRRRLESQCRAYAAGRVDQDRVTASARGWVAHAAHGDTWGLRRAVLGSVRLSPPARPA